MEKVTDREKRIFDLLDKPNGFSKEENDKVKELLSCSFRNLEKSNERIKKHLKRIQKIQQDRDEYLSSIDYLLSFNYYFKYYII